MWHGSDSLSICMHLTLTKCSGGVKIKNLEFWAGLLPLDLAVYKLSKTKGSNHVTEAGFCCLRRRPEETLQGQRQQSSQEIKILLPPPKTRRMVPRSKAAIIPRNQEFAAFGLGGDFLVLFMPGWPCKTEDFYNSFMNFCGILPSDNYLFVLLRMIGKHKNACLCTVLTMFEQKYTKMPIFGNYYRIVTNF